MTAIPALRIKGPAVSSKNARRIAYRQSGVPFVVPDVKVRQWMKGAIDQLRAQWGARPEISGPVEVELLIYFGARQRLDVDNAASSILDALERAGVLKNDNLVRTLRATKSTAERGNPRAEITIRELGPG